MKTDLFDDPKSGIIVVDPGHGGIDGGSSFNGLLEKDINLDISKKLKVILEARGYTVILTREEDVSLENLCNTGDNRHHRDLKARTNIINNSAAQLFLSIHCNSYIKNRSADGSIVLYTEKFTRNKALAYCVQRTLNNILVDGEKRTLHDPRKVDALYLLNYSHIPGILIETAFLTNGKEHKLLLTDAFREDISRAIANGVEKYLKEADQVYK